MSSISIVCPAAFYYVLVISQTTGSGVSEFCFPSLEMTAYPLRGHLAEHLVVLPSSPLNCALGGASFRVRRKPKWPPEGPLWGRTEAPASAQHHGIDLLLAHHRPYQAFR